MRVPGRINQQEGIIEYMAVGPRGKVHESVDFWIDCPACDYEDSDDATDVAQYNTCDSIINKLYAAN